MEEAHEADTSPIGGTLINHDDLAFWPAESAEDQIIKQTCPFGQAQPAEGTWKNR